MSGAASQRPVEPSNTSAAQTVIDELIDELTLSEVSFFEREEIDLSLALLHLKPKHGIVDIFCEYLCGEPKNVWLGCLHCWSLNFEAFCNFFSTNIRRIALKFGADIHILPSSFGANS